MTFPPRWLAHPQALWLLLALPTLVQLAVLAWLRRRRAWRLLGQMPALQMLATRGKSRRLVRGLLTGLGLLLVGAAVAGPQWGREETTIDSAARDLVVILDVSRSMLAETPSRQLRAQRLLADLAATLKQRGGHRIALVVGAARAQLVVPLTTDYEHFREAVLEQDAAHVPEELRPGGDNPASGTRLGASIGTAVGAHDPRYRGSQVILLVSDGDDPANDDEWKQGAAEARRAGIGVFTLGVGDPHKASTIPTGNGVQMHDGKPVHTQLREKVLQDIAQRTDGTYFPVRTQSVAPGNLFPAILEAAAARPREVPPVTMDKPRYRWFLAGGMVCLVLGLVVGDRRSAASRVRRVEAGDSQAPRKHVAAAAALAWVALLLVSAGPPEPLDALRQGNEAFERKDYAQALKYYEEAEERAADPGLVAFNKGAALFRLGRHREAELCYLRCLQDRAAPPQRLHKAQYDLGTVLLLRGTEMKDLEALRRAMDFFQSCAAAPGADSALADSAEHNGELARLLWLKLRAELKSDDPPVDENPGAKGPKHKNQDTQPDKKGNDLAKSGNATEPGDPKQASEKDLVDPRDKLLGSGSLPTLPDAGQLLPLDGQDVRARLAREIERIENQKKNRSPRLDTPRDVMDW